MSPEIEYTDKRKIKPTHRCYIGEFVAPTVKWLDNAYCPICGSKELIEVRNFGLCINCNKFVKPNRTCQ